MPRSLVKFLSAILTINDLSWINSRTFPEAFDTHAIGAIMEIFEDVRKFSLIHLLRKVTSQIPCTFFILVHHLFAEMTVPLQKGCAEVCSLAVFLCDGLNQRFKVSFSSRIFGR